MGVKLEKQEHYGKVLHGLVREKRMTIRELSGRMGLSQQGVYNIFRAKSPGIESVVKMLEALGEVKQMSGLQQYINTVNSKGEKIKQHIDESFIKTEGQLEERINENRKYYAGKVDQMMEMMSKINEQLDMSREIIRAKDELIEELRSQLNRVKNGSK
jgi:predicted transcriptional regulator